MAVRVAVVGAGVSGLSVGLCLIDGEGGRDLNITIIAERFSSDGIVSDYAGAIVSPPGSNYTGGVNSKFVEDGRRWSTVTYEWLKNVYGSESGCGVEKVMMLRCYEDKLSLPWFKGLHPELRSLSRDEASYYRLSSQLQTVWKFNCYCIDPPKYLQYLTRRFREKGGLMIKKKLNSLNELSADYDIVINCTGLGSRELVGDYSVYPVSGQIVQVQGSKVPGIIYNIIIEPGSSHIAYIIPRNDSILLGSSAVKHDWSTEVDPLLTESIYCNCTKLYPPLKESEVVGGWTALRPARDTVRLEVDKGFKTVLVIHNYGHGGQGFIFSWGCATQVKNIVEKYLHNNMLIIPSKL